VPGCYQDAALCWWWCKVLQDFVACFKVKYRSQLSGHNCVTTIFKKKEEEDHGRLNCWQGMHPKVHWCRMVGVGCRFKAAVLEMGDWLSSGDSWCPTTLVPDMIPSVQNTTVRGNRSWTLWGSAEGTTKGAWQRLHGARSSSITDFILHSPKRQLWCEVSIQWYKSGLNDSLWAPWFRLLMNEQDLCRVEPSRSWPIWTLANNF